VIRVISLGAGVQSSALLLMALEGRFGDRPDYAVFADTQWEPKATYQWLLKLCGVEYEQVPDSKSPRFRTIPGLYRGGAARFPTHVVTNGSVRDSALRAAVGGEERGDGRFTTMPVYLRNPDGSAGMGRRQCTDEFNLAPLRRFFRELGATHLDPVESWIGISTDEAHRMKPSLVRYAVNRYPLLERGLSREDCANYLLDRMGEVAPKSSCVGCPFKSDPSWARLRTESPEEFADAVDVDRRIRHARDLRAEQYLHRSLIPLGDIAEFRHERQARMFFDEFGNECEGVCGV